jgi:hypothetical protein
VRDDNDYQAMSRLELRAQLQRVAKELAVWEYALSLARVEQNRYWTDGYSTSIARSTTERKAEAEVHAGPFQREVYENEGNVRFFTTIRDLILELLRDVSHETVPRETSETD